LVCPQAYFAALLISSTRPVISPGPIVASAVALPSRRVSPLLKLRNEKGVVLELRGAKLGVEVSANLPLVTITMK
jgi:hypothetical protein